MKKRLRKGVAYATVGAVCDDCARAAGFVPKDKVVGVWTDVCGICGETKACTDLWHDWTEVRTRDDGK